MPVKIKSEFTPMTYDELSLPLIQATNAQMALEEAYMDTNDKVAAVLALASQATDRESYMKLKSYADDLKAQADALAALGLRRSSRGALMNMRRRYSDDILPILAAAARRKELSEEQRKLMLANPDMLFERMAGNISLDDFVNSPNIDYGMSYNGATITKRVADAVQAVAQGITSMQTDGHLTPYQIKVLTTNGFDPNDIEKVIRGDIDSNTLLQSIRDRVLNSIDLYRNGDLETRDKALAYANEGLRYGTGKSSYSHINDEEAIADLKYQYDTALLDYKAKKEAEQAAAAAEEENLAAIVPLNIYSLEELANMPDMKKYSKYFDKQSDGTYKLNLEGINEYNKAAEVVKYGQMNPYVSTLGGALSGAYGFTPPLVKVTEHSDLYNTLNKALGADIKGDDKDSKIIEKAGDYYKSATDTRYDASKLTEYQYSIDSSDLENWNNRVAEAVAESGHKVRRAKWNKDTKQWEDAEVVSIEDALADKGKISSIQYSTYGVTMKITNSKGISTRYQFPYGTNDRNRDNLNLQLKGAERAQTLANNATDTSKITIPEDIRKALISMKVIESTIPLTVTKRELENVYKRLLSGAFASVSQFGNTNSNKATSWEAIAY